MAKTPVGGRTQIAVGVVAVTSLLTISCQKDSSPTAGDTVQTSAAPTSASPAVLRDPSIPGIGATRADWDASHRPTPSFDNGMVYGYDPSLPRSLADQGQVYFAVQDAETKTGRRITHYFLNIKASDRADAIERVKQELPSYAAEASHLNLDSCYRVQFKSPTLEAAQPGNMVEVQIQFMQDDG